MFARDGWECKIFAWRDQIPGFSSVSCSDKPILQLSFGGLKLAVWPESFFFALRWFIRYIWDMHIILPVFKAFLSRVYWEHSISRNIDIFGPEATKKLVLFCWNFHPFSKNLFFFFRWDMIEYFKHCLMRESCLLGRQLTHRCLVF